MEEILMEEKFYPTEAMPTSPLVILSIKQETEWLKEI